MGRDARNARRAGLRSIWPRFFVSAIAAVGCTVEPALTVQMAAPAAATPERTAIRGLETGRRVDLDLARRTLERFFALPDGRDVLDRGAFDLGDLPAPTGTSWVILDDAIRIDGAVDSPLGRLALVRVDDGLGVTLADVRSVTRERGADDSVVRIALRPERRAAFERLCRSEQGGVLVFVTGDRAEFAVRVGDGVPTATGDVLLAGLAPGEGARLLAGRIGSDR